MCVVMLECDTCQLGTIYTLTPNRDVPRVYDRSGGGGLSRLTARFQVFEIGFPTIRSRFVEHLVDAALFEGFLYENESVGPLHVSGF